MNTNKKVYQFYLVVHIIRMDLIFLCTYLHYFSIKGHAANVKYFVCLDVSIPAILSYALYYYSMREGVGKLMMSNKEMGGLIIPQPCVCVFCR